MTKKSKVLLIGMEPSVLNYAMFPGLNEENLRSLLLGDIEKLNTLAYSAQMCFITYADDQMAKVASLLENNDFDCVLIGAGVRKIDPHFSIFEQLINVIHTGAPNAKICFNSGPSDSVEAVLRWV